MSSIPEFQDSYHLPEGEHPCTIEDIETSFLFTDVRKQKWKDFKDMLDRMNSLGLKPKSLLINGSFVTGRKEPGDVDFAALIPPETAQQAITAAIDQEDKKGIELFINKNNQGALRALFGAHLLVADNEDMLQLWSDLFRKGKNGSLREPDPAKDPEWVVTPNEKGVLKVDYSD